VPLLQEARGMGFSRDAAAPNSSADCATVAEVTRTITPVGLTYVRAYDYVPPHGFIDEQMACPAGTAAVNGGVENFEHRVVVRPGRHGRRRGAPRRVPPCGREHSAMTRT
jgi:hypothetical protein